MAGRKKDEPRGGSTQLATLLGLSTQRINQLASEGVLAREAEGDYILPSAIAAYYAYKYKDKEELDYWEEKTKHELAKRQLTELELALKRHEAHTAKDVELVMSDMLVNLRNQLLAIPSKLAPILAEQPRDYIDDVLSGEINSRLSELSNYTPTMFDNVCVEETGEDPRD